MSYAKLSREDAAAAMGVSASHFDRFQGTKRSTAKPGNGRPGPPVIPSWQKLWALADACGLPRDFFSADFHRLHEIVPAGLPRFGPIEPRDLLEEVVRDVEDAARSRDQPTAPPAEQPPDETPEDRRKPGA